MAELIRLGAYRRGSDPLVDEAVHYFPALDAFLAQNQDRVGDLGPGLCRAGQDFTPAK